MGKEERKEKIDPQEEVDRIIRTAKTLGVEVDENGFIITNEKKETNVPGILAAGDISTGQLKQDVTAVADGAIAAMSANRFLKG